MSEAEERFRRLSTEAELENFRRAIARASTLRAPRPQGGLSIGTTLCGGRFVITRRLGEGGMGVVYAADDTERRAQVALKLLPLLDAAGIYGLKSEFRSIADVSHPNLVRLHELFADEGEFFFSMELVDGEPFDRYLRADPEVARVRSALLQLSAAVSAIHAAGKLHRDLKPSNVLVTSKDRVVVLDFGLASDPEPGGIGQTLGDGMVTGTPAYMAPEQAAGRPATQASDVYAIGVMLFEALSGALPFEGASGEILASKQRDVAPSARSLGADERLAALCDAMLAREPALRPSLETVRAQLLAIAQGAAARDAASLGTSMRAPIVTGSVPAEREALIGRDTELRALRAAYDATLVGGSVLVFVSGESGMGKSALLSAFLQDLRERSQSFVLAGRCFEREAVPFQGFDSVVDDLTRVLRKLSMTETAALMPREVFALARLFPVLERIDAVVLAPTKQITDPLELRRRAFDAFAELLGRMRDRRPLVLCVDDWQWVDRDSTLLMQSLLGQAPLIPMLTIVSHRSEGASEHLLLGRLRAAARSHRKLELREINVSPLAEDATLELARRLLGEQPDEALARAAAREAAGSPFFAGELARYAAALGATSSEQAPLSLSQVVAQRLDSLSAPSRRALEVMALAARPLPLEVVLEAAAASHADLDALRSQHLMRAGRSENPKTVECYHDRIRETVERELDPERRKQRYAKLAAELSTRDDADPELMSRCFEGAGDRIEAAHHAELAGDRAASAMAFEHAARLYQKALALDSQDPNSNRSLLVKLGDASADAGRGLAAAAAYRHAAESAPHELSIDLRRRAAEQLLRTGHAQEGTALIRAVCAELGMRLPEGPRSAMLSMLGTRTMIRMRGLRSRANEQGKPISERERLRLETAGSVVTGLFNFEPVVAAGLADRYLLRALSAGDPAHLARAFGFQAYFRSFAQGGSLDRCKALLEQAARYAEQSGKPEVLGFVRMMTGHVDVHCGSVATSREHYRAAFALLRGCSGVAWDVDIGHMYDQFTAFLHGEYGNIVRDVPPLLSAALERGNVLIVAAMSGWAGAPAWLVSDDAAGYRERIAEARGLWTPQREMQWPDWFLLTGELLLALYSGAPGSGFARVHAQWPAYHRSLFARTEAVRAMNHWVRGGCALSALQRPSVSNATRKEWLSVAAQDADALAHVALRQGQAWGLGLRAGLALARGDLDGGKRELQGALEAYQSVRYGMYATAARRRLGELIGGDAGRELLAQGDLAMRAEGIVNLDAMTEMLVPGCRSQ